ncbi:putative origin recognition complex, subunit 5, P-loop containing nucleoside triphosphate hydrolase [Lupinus albus]|uniref:Putative origin recognition complex, subunit 5, P-loop containing nucleoside triphosphate hydrolase n=1 Tax=Lupinus albus TaxID=3870 RepID=A0A6A4PL34_LUPAL|nr:putative origin recognition complex, subunit 5, P-loop containing nucleoside triphosphate hydrolase [Lupinus albus]
MDKDGVSLIPRRTTRSLASASNSVPDAKVNSLGPLTIDDLLVGGDPISLDDLISSFPGRSTQILQISHLLGSLNSPILPLFVYGGSSTGKTSIILQLFRHLNRPLVYSSCRTCYNQRILFESILNQLLLHRKNASNDYSNAKRCERPSDFVNCLREALTNAINNLKEKSETQRGIGNMIYLVFDNFQLVREWDKSSTILPLLFNLHDLLKMPEVGLIFISSTSPDTFYSNMGYVEPIPVYFPDYTEGDIRQILLRNQPNQNLYSSFLKVALSHFCRMTRQVDELSTALKPLYEKYCEPLNNKEVIPTGDMKRKLFTLLVESREETKQKGNHNNLKHFEEIGDLDFHMSTSAKYLLISAFLASRNPATLDASLFDAKGGSDNRKRKRKASEKVLEKKETLEEELLMKGPGSFPLERLLAIFQCLVSVSEEPYDEEEQKSDGLGVQGGNGGLMNNVLLQLSSLCNANFIYKGRSCPIEGAMRYRSTISEELALKVARSLKFPLSKYLYRR